MFNMFASAQPPPTTPLPTRNTLQPSVQTTDVGKDEVKVDTVPASNSTSAVLRNRPGAKRVGKKGRAKKMAVDRSFNELGTAMPFAAKYNMPNHKFSLVHTDVTTNWLASSTLVEIDKQFTFLLSQVNGYSNLATIFDQYRVNQIEFWLTPQRASVPTTAGYTPGLLISAIDWDDPGVATFAELTEYESAIVSHGLDGHYRRYQPHVSIPAYAGGFSGYKNEASPWIDINYSTVEHYGVKVSTSITSDIVLYDLIVRAHLEFRTVR